MSEARRRLVHRLDHKLRSSLLLLRENALRSGSPALYDLAEEALRRASGLSAAAVPAADEPRPLRPAAVLASVIPGVVIEGEAGAIAIAPEADLKSLLGRLPGWLGGGLRFRLESVPGWCVLDVSAAEPAPPDEVPELGEPLVRLIVEEGLGGGLEVPGPGRAVLRLPAP